ncbi:hypothetical protein BCS42_00540 [Crenothrix sp. D3]|nr:hypothetical protein BCS42_00540 [Crenothrix sp. D3]
MLNFQLAIQPQTEQRLRKILNDTQDIEAFAQGIINYQITELQKAILNIQLDLQSYEKNYQMSSDSFYEKFLQGDLNDDEDFMIWSGLYELLIENKNKLCELK